MKQKELELRNSVYLMERNGLSKIGRTTNIEKRLRAIGQVTLAAEVTCASVEIAALLERRVQRAFLRKRIGKRGEWFSHIHPVDFWRAVNTEMDYCVTVSRRFL